MHFLHVVVEAALCRKTCRAVLNVALVRPLPSMQAQVRLQITFLEESFFAVSNWAHVFSLALMLVQVDLEALLARIRLITALVVTLELARL